MGSHSDLDHAKRTEFLKELAIRAEVMTDLGKNSVQNDRVDAEWKHDGMRCQLLPDDRQGILRISVGGGEDTPVRGDYCNVRGDIGKCINLLERAILALRKAP